VVFHSDEAKQVLLTFVRPFCIFIPTDDGPSGQKLVAYW